MQPIGFMQPRFLEVCNLKKVRVDYLICKAWYIHKQKLKELTKALKLMKKKSKITKDEKTAEKEDDDDSGSENEEQNFETNQNEKQI